MKGIASARLTRNILLPGWILTFGVLFANSPSQGLPLSATLLFMGLVVIPALMLIGGRTTRP